MRTTIASFIDDYARRGDATALVHRRGLRTVEWSYGRVAATARRFARELERRETGRGERVLFWAANSPEWVAAFLGCALRGAVVVPLDVESAPDFVGRVQQQVGAKLLLHDGDVPQQLLDVNLPRLRLEELEATVAGHDDAPCAVEGIGADDLVEIIYTSGTTAEPRGVCLTHRNLLANIAPLEHEIQKYLRWERIVHPIRFLNLLPLSHIFGQFMGIFVPQLLGGEVHFQESLNPSQIMDAVRKRRVSVVVTVPRLLDTLRDAVERDYDARGELEEFRRALEAAAKWHPLRRWWAFRRVHRRFGLKFWAFVSGGAALSAETESFWHRLGFAVLQGYGMTETASLISVNHPFKRGRGSVGKTLPGQEVKLDEHGEILVRGANVSPGYWGGGVRPLKSDDGWLRTGDMGEMDAAGNIYFKGRKKDVIVTAAGLNIYPEDLEAALNRQPEIRASAVVALEGAHGPEPLAVVILRDEKTDPAPVVSRANASLARHQQIRRWFVWPDADFPRTPTHKIRKRDILQRMKDEGGGMKQGIRVGMRDEGGGMREGRLPENSEEFILHPSSFILDSVVRVGGEVGGELDASASLATDMKLDSLGRVELLSALEDRYQIEIDESAFTAATTLGDIEKVVHEGAGAGDRTRRYPYPAWTQAFPVTWFRVVFYYLVVLPITRLMCWVGVRGKEHLRRLDSPVLFVANHVTMADHGLILSALPGRYRRSLAIAMEGERLRHWRNPPPGTSLWTRLRWFVQYVLVVSIFNTFPLPQKSGFRRSFAYAGEAVDRGYSILVFPEGTRTENGQMNPFMRGTGLLAANLNVPVVPVRIDGLFELKQRRQYFSRPGSVTVTFGTPVTFAQGTDPADITRELERLVSNL